MTIVPPSLLGDIDGSGMDGPDCGQLRGAEPDVLRVWNTVELREINGLVIVHINVVILLLQELSFILPTPFSGQGKPFMTQSGFEMTKSGVEREGSGALLVVGSIETLKIADITLFRHESQSIPSQSGRRGSVCCCCRCFCYCCSCCFWCCFLVWSDRADFIASRCEIRLQQCNEDCD